MVHMEPGQTDPTASWGRRDRSSERHMVRMDRTSAHRVHRGRDRRDHIAVRRVRNLVHMARRVRTCPRRRDTDWWRSRAAGSKVRQEHRVQWGRVGRRHWACSWWVHWGSNSTPLGEIYRATSSQLWRAASAFISIWNAFWITCHISVFPFPFSSAGSSQQRPA